MSCLISVHSRLLLNRTFISAPNNNDMKTMLVPNLLTRSWRNSFPSVLAQLRCFLHIGVLSTVRKYSRGLSSVSRLIQVWAEISFRVSTEDVLCMREGRDPYAGSSMALLRSCALCVCDSSRNRDSMPASACMLQSCREFLLVRGGCGAARRKSFCAHSTSRPVSRVCRVGRLGVSAGGIGRQASNGSQRKQRVD